MGRIIVRVEHIIKVPFSSRIVGQQWGPYFSHVREHNVQKCRISWRTSSEANYRRYMTVILIKSQGIVFSKTRRGFIKICTRMSEIRNVLFPAAMHVQRQLKVVRDFNAST